MHSLPLICHFTCCSFGRSRSKRIKWKIPKVNNLCCKPCTVLRGQVKPHAVLLCPAQGANHPFAQRPCTVDAPRPLVPKWPLSSQIGCRGITVLVFTSHLFYLAMAPKRKHSDDDSPDTPERSCRASFKRQGEQSTLGYFERDHIYITVSTMYCYDLFYC